MNKGVCMCVGVYKQSQVCYKKQLDDITDQGEQSIPHQHIQF